MLTNPIRHRYTDTIRAAIFRSVDFTEVRAKKNQSDIFIYPEKAGAIFHFLYPLPYIQIKQLRSCRGSQLSAHPFSGKALHKRLAGRLLSDLILSNVTDNK